MPDDYTPLTDEQVRTTRAYLQDIDGDTYTMSTLALLRLLDDIVHWRRRAEAAEAKNAVLAPFGHAVSCHCGDGVDPRCIT